MAKHFSQGEEVEESISEQKLKAAVGGVEKESEASEKFGEETNSDRSEALNGKYEAEKNKKESKFQAEGMKDGILGLQNEHREQESTLQKVSELNINNIRHQALFQQEDNGEKVKKSMEELSKLSGQVQKLKDGQRQASHLKTRPSLSQLEDELNEKAALLSEIFAAIREKQRDSEKVIADLKIRRERFEADNSSLVVELGEANLKAADLDKVVKAMEEKEQAISSALASKNQSQLKDEKEVSELKSQRKLLVKEILQLNQHQTVLKKKNTGLQVLLKEEQAECSVLLHKLKDVKQKGSREIIALKKFLKEQEEKVDFYERRKNDFRIKFEKARKEREEKEKEIKDMEETHEEVRSNLNHKMVLLGNEFVVMKKHVQTAEETFGEDIGVMEYIIEKSLLPLQIKLSKCTQKLQIIKTRWATLYREKEELEGEKDELETKVQFLEEVISNLRAAKGG